MNRYENRKLTKQVFRSTRRQKIIKEITTHTFVITFAILAGYAVVSVFKFVIWLFG